jgi:hypothetical protein
MAYVEVAREQPKSAAQSETPEAAPSASPTEHPPAAQSEPSAPAQLDRVRDEVEKEIHQELRAVDGDSLLSRAQRGLSARMYTERQ